MKKHLGVIVALPTEARCILPGLKQFKTPIPVNDHCSMIVSGMGYERATEAAHSLLQSSCNHLISWGCCAALHDTVDTGDIIIPNHLVNSSNQIMTLQLPTAEQNLALKKTNITIHYDALANSHEILDTQEKKRQLFDTTNALVADMESYAVANVAKYNQIGCTVIRAVSDNLQQYLPLSASQYVNEYGQPNFPEFYWSLVKKPQDIPAVVKLGLSFNKACNSLKKLSEIFLTN